MRGWIIGLTFVATGAIAQEWPLRPGDEALDTATLEATLRGNSLTFFDDGVSEFYEDGRYTYTYANDGGTGYGYWRIEARGTVCIDFVNGFARCDMYINDGTRLVLLTEKGDRFPIRP